MNINQKILNALTEMIGGDIWALSKPPEEDPDEFVVYNPENEYLDYGDDQDQDAELSYQVHWYRKGIADYVAKCKSIRDALRAAGFLIEPGIGVVYEKDTSGNVGWTHVTIVIRAEEG